MEKTQNLPKKQNRPISNEECKTQSPEDTFEEKVSFVINSAEKAKRRKRADYNRKLRFDQEIEEAYIQAVSYRCDTTRYRCKRHSTSDVVMNYAFPPLLALLIVFATLATISATQGLTNGSVDLVLESFNILTMVKYDSYQIVDNIDTYLRNKSIVWSNCNGYIQGRFEPLKPAQLNYLKNKYPKIRKASRAESYIWTKSLSIHNTMKNGNCPPTIIMELEK